MAAGATLIVLDGHGSEARQAALALGVGAVASAAVMLMTEDALILRWFPSVMTVGTAVMMTTGVGVNWSLLSLGSGMIIGLRIDTSMLLGVVLAWVVAPYALLRYGVLAPTFVRNDVLFWVMWPATGMMVAGGLTALVLKWPLLVKTFRNLSTANVGTDDFPLTWVGAGVAVTGVALVIIQKVSLGLDVWMTVVAILLSLPLMLVGLRVLGVESVGEIADVELFPLQRQFAFQPPRLAITHARNQRAVIRLCLPALTAEAQVRFDVRASSRIGGMRSQNVIRYVIGRHHHLTLVMDS